MGFLFTNIIQMDNDNLTKEERLDLEEQAIEALLSYGVKFSVPLKMSPKDPPVLIRTWNSIFQKHQIKWRDKRINKGWNVEIAEVPDINLSETKNVYMRYFHIKPMYLGTMDMIRKLALEMEYDEKKVQELTITEGDRLMKFMPLMAKIVAVATLNCSEAAAINSKEVKELQNFYLHHLTSSRLQKLCGIIAKMSDKGGFISSIRLIQKADVTAPKAVRVE